MEQDDVRLSQFPLASFPELKAKAKTKIPILVRKRPNLSSMHCMRDIMKNEIPLTPNQVNAILKTTLPRPSTPLIPLRNWVCRTPILFFVHFLHCFLENEFKPLLFQWTIPKKWILFHLTVEFFLWWLMPDIIGLLTLPMQENFWWVLWCQNHFQPEQNSPSGTRVYS